MSTLYIQYPQSGGGGGSTGSQTGVPYSVGTFDGFSPKNANGGVIGSFSLYLQGATATLPGLVSSATQTFAGIKTFNDPIVMAANGSSSYIQGSLLYDNTSLSPTFYNDVASISLQIGQEEWIRVYNNSSATILNGKAVYMNGSTQSPLTPDFPTVGLAVASAQSTSQLLGIATHDIGNGQFGYVTQIGKVHGLDTTPFGRGQRLWLSTASAGGLQSVNPIQPFYSVFVGYVVDIGSTTGSLLLPTIRTGVSSPFVNPMTQSGDMITSSGTGNAIALALGTAYQVLTVASGQALPQWQSLSAITGSVAGSILKTGPLDGATATVYGATIGSGQLYMQSAQAALPGVMSSTTQTFTGIKSFEKIATNNTSGSAAVLVNVSSASLTDVSFTIKQTASQTGDLFQIMDASNAPQAIFDSGGNFKFFHNTLNTSRFDLRPSINTSAISSGLTVRYSMFVSQAGTVAAGVGGGIALGGPNNVGTNTTYAAIWTTKDNATPGDVSAKLSFAPKNNATGNFQRALDIDAGGNSFFSGNISLVGSSSSRVTFQCPPAGNVGYTLVWPVSQGSASWVLQNDGAGNMSWINSLVNPMTATGDIIVGSGTGATARLGVGPAGTILVSDTTASNSISWQPPVTRNNALVNSAFDYWQAAGSGSSTISSGTSVVQYLADQWWLDNRTTATATTVTVTQTLPLLLPSGYALKAAITGAAALGSGSYYIGQMLSNASSRPFYGQRASASIQVIALNNIVSAVNIAAISNTTEAIGTYSIIASATVSITSASYTNVALNNFLVGTAQGLAGVIGFRVGAQTISSGTVNTTANQFQLEQGMLNVGPVALPFSRQYTDPTAELNACKYFYQRSFNTTAANGDISAAGCVAYVYAAISSPWTVPLAPTMRSNPVINTYSNITGALNKIRDNTTTSDLNANATNQGQSAWTHNTSASTGHSVSLHWTADARM